ncbi:hypothetical protein [Campylobacter sp. MG1]|uniref:hypothetical protein n=1 Tax=Campylobacter sp. MG1 TaxID=2976332 RepID=UPI00226CDE54|nr:hypothetical protein [Campylobacter sp. MG1]
MKNDKFIVLIAILCGFFIGLVAGIVKFNNIILILIFTLLFMYIFYIFSYIMIIIFIYFDKQETKKIKSNKILDENIFNEFKIKEEKIKLTIKDIKEELLNKYENI